MAEGQGVSVQLPQQLLDAGRKAWQDADANQVRARLAQGASQLLSRLGLRHKANLRLDNGFSHVDLSLTNLPEDERSPHSPTHRQELLRGIFYVVFHMFFL